MEVLQFEFFRNALWAGLLVSIACAIVGTYVVINRIVFITGGIAHAAYGGIGLGVFLGINPVLGAVVFSLLAAFGMGTVSYRTKQRIDTLIGVMWAVGMAMGIVFADLSHGYTAGLMSYLFGSILTISRGDLILMGCLDVLVLSVSLKGREIDSLGKGERGAWPLIWKVVFTESAVKMLKSIKDRRIRSIICKKIDELDRHPESQGKPLVGELKTLRSVRVAGQRYRIIYRLEKEKIVVLVVALGIRKEGSKKDIFELAKKLIRQKLL